MGTKRWASLLIFLVVLCVLCRSGWAADLEKTLVYDGAERDYIVHTPPGFDHGEFLPMVLVLHGGGGEPEGIIRQSGMNDVADVHMVLSLCTRPGPFRVLANFIRGTQGHAAGRWRKRILTMSGLSRS